jgi:hypothetical protein
MKDVLIGIFMIACAVVLLSSLGGCATNPQTSAALPLPSIECRGKGTITGTGNVSVMMGSASNNFTIQADCGQDGFVFRQTEPL